MLEILVGLLDEWHMAGIRYCHFKSNQHVAAGMAGKTDLDILVERSSHAEVVACLVASGFKRFSARLPAAYPAVEDWLGFDPDSGELVHLHLHWQLVAGEPNLKGYRIPWEEDVLEHRIFDDASRIYIASPEIELLLLLVRASLKFRTRDALRQWLGKPYPSPRSDILKEYEWLVERVDQDILRSQASRLLSPEIAELIIQLLGKNGFDYEVFHSIRRRVARLLNSYRTYCPLQARVDRWFREAYSKVTQILNRKFGTLIVRRRIPATGGLIIAFLGADGSGKSTQVKQLVKWLGWKLDVGYVYFGSGDGPVSLLRKPLVLVKKYLRSKSRPLDNFPKQDEPNKNVVRKASERRLSNRFAADLIELLWAMALLYEKRKNIRRAIQARNKGMVVFCDRFPQNQLIGFNDGPLLSRWLDKRGFYGYFARCEQRGFDEMVRISPDLVIKLNVSEDVAIRRKSDTPIEMVARKIDAVKSLDFGSAVEVLEVDANQDLATVTIELRRKIWQLL